MEENNKKGFNTIYLVIGVATLVVALVGATFAYFSATATDDTITGEIAEAGGLEVIVKSITYDSNNERTGNKIIPLNLIVNQTLKEGSDSEYVDSISQFDSAMANSCVDSLGNNICEVYKITVKNQSATSTIQVRGKLNLTSDAKNMYWKLIDATTTTKTVGDNEVEVLSTASEQDYYVPISQGTDGNLTIDTTTKEAKNISLAGSGEQDFYVVVWLEEIGTAQENDDASTADIVRKYNGAITFDAVDANGAKSGVTATFLAD